MAWRHYTQHCMHTYVPLFTKQYKLVMPCGWGVKAGMVRVWVAGKNCVIPCYTRATSERFRDQSGHYKAL